MILLFSGGVDSYIAWHYLKKPQTVYFNLQTRYSHKELVHVRNLIPSTIIEDCLDMSSREVEETAYVPFRNLHLALLAAHHAETVVIAGLKDDKVSDKNERAFQIMSETMNHLDPGKKFRVVSPFWNKTKEQIIQWYIKTYQGDIDSLKGTLSCYSEELLPFCGKCAACFRKWCAFRANDIPIPEFTNSVLMKEYYRRAISGIYYIPERNQTIIRELKRFEKEKGVKLWKETI
jgi:7-cyano-7-deazaguanine synthase